MENDPSSVISLQILDFCVLGHQRILQILNVLIGLGWAWSALALLSVCALTAAFRSLVCRARRASHDMGFAVRRFCVYEGAVSSPSAEIAKEVTPANSFHPEKIACEFAVDFKEGCRHAFGDDLPTELKEKTKQSFAFCGEEDETRSQPCQSDEFVFRRPVLSNGFYWTQPALFTEPLLWLCHCKSNQNQRREPLFSRHRVIDFRANPQRVLESPVKKRLVRLFGVEEESISGIDLSWVEDKGVLSTVSNDDNIIRLWDIDSAKPIDNFGSSAAVIHHSKENSSNVVSSFELFAEKLGVCLWDCRAPSSSVRPFLCLSGFNASNLSPAYSFEENRIWVADCSGKRLWDLRMNSSLPALIFPGNHAHFQVDSFTENTRISSSFFMEEDDCCEDVIENCASLGFGFERWRGPSFLQQLANAFCLAAPPV